MRLFKTEIKVVQQRPLTEEELDNAFAVVNSDPFWRAIHQVIDAHIEDARDQASDYTIKDQALPAASFVGGWDCLHGLQQEFLKRQEAALSKK